MRRRRRVNVVRLLECSYRHAEEEKEKENQTSVEWLNAHTDVAAEEEVQEIRRRSSACSQ